MELVDLIDLVVHAAQRLLAHGLDGHVVVLRGHLAEIQLVRVEGRVKEDISVVLMLRADSSWDALDALVALARALDVGVHLGAEPYEFLDVERLDSKETQLLLLVDVELAIRVVGLAHRLEGIRVLHFEDE